jgi:FkbM family methyltransferase
MTRGGKPVGRTPRGPFSSHADGERHIEKKTSNPRRIVKELTKCAIRCALSVLPHRSFETLLDELCVVLGSDIRRRQSRFRLLSRLAADSHVVSLRVSGDYGVMQSAAGDSHILFRYSEERGFADRTNKLIAEFFGDGAGSYIDIGANIGMTVIPIARNPRVRCLAFEPEPTNFGNLLANIAANCPHQNVVAEQIALFSRTGRLDLELANGNLGDHRIHLSDAVGRFGEHQRRIIGVQAYPLDEAVSELQLPLAIKIDTQGAEPYVFVGGRKVIARAGLLVSEFWPYGMHRMGGDIDEMFDQLIASFNTIATAEYEEGELGKAIVAPAACEWLSEFYRQYVDDPNRYCDVIARK